MMRLELDSYAVRNVSFGPRTALAKSVLEINPEELSGMLRRDPNIQAVRIDLARPGEKTRIIHILDAIEPRMKLSGCNFPGFLDAPELVGQGITNRLAGLAIIATADLDAVEGSQSPKETILDMAGPGAPLSHFSETLNLVLGFEVSRGISMAAATASIRLAGLRAGVYLAQATRGLEPDLREVFELGPADPELPKVLHISVAMREEGDVHATYFYGEPVPNLPLLLHPNEELDGAIVSGDSWGSSHRAPTYSYLNDPVTRGLYQLHGRALHFAGMMLCRGLVPTEAGKRRQAVQAAKLARWLGAKGAILTMSNAGNACLDQMLICQECERAGIKTVLGVSEYGDSDGRGNPLVASVPEAVALVSVGNIDEPTTLPAMERVLGGDRFLSGYLYEPSFVERRPAEELTIGRRHVYCSTSQLGFNRSRVLARQQIPLAARPRTLRGKLRVVHYLNQFFGGIGSEGQANAPVQERPGPVGPGLPLAKEFGDQAEIVATVICGDNTFHQEKVSMEEILARIAKHDPDVIVAGPAFASGRYGMACGAVCAAVEERLRIPAVAAMFRENPGVEMHGAKVMIVPTGSSLKTMAEVLPVLARLALKRGYGKPLGPAGEEGYLPCEARKNAIVEETGAERMVAMLLKRLRGEPFETEIPLPVFEPVTPAPPITDLSKATLALVTEAGVVPAGNPAGIEARRASKWAAYPIDGLNDLRCGEFRSVHGGIDTTEIDKDPDRALPLDVMRELEREGKIGNLHGKFYVTVGASAALGPSRRFGREIARELVEAGVQGVILTGT